jgi:C-terminal processing protease CtpA/Prc
MADNELVQSIADLISARYVFPDVAERVAARLHQRLHAGAYAVTDATELAARLTDDLRQASGDRHLRVRHEAEPHVPEAPGATVREQNDRAEHCRRTGYGIASVQRVAGNVAVLDIRELVEPELSRPACEAALASVADAAALVIDLRQCVGGDPATVALVCSALVDRRTPLSRIVPRNGPVEAFWADPAPDTRSFGGRKPLLIAVAAFTFSGAEMLAYDLQAMGRAVIVGETTGGGANPCNFHWPSPHFSLLLPEAYARNPITGGNWEGCGVAPDAGCRAEDALNVAIGLAGERVARGG